MLLIKNIKELVGILSEETLLLKGKEMSSLNRIKNAFLIIKDDKIFDFGKMENYNKANYKITEEIDANDKIVMPSFCDSHTHLVYAGSREIEYSDKIRGLSYEEIAKRGGGILNSSKLLNETSEDELYRQSKLRLDEIISLGTGAVEVKSGYGLNTQNELKLLRVIKRLKENSDIIIKSNFLAAHAFR